MKKIFISTLIIMISFIICAVALADEDNENFGTGLIWDSQESIDELYRDTYAVETVLPSSVDLIDSFPEPGNQGSQNSCVAWAVAYAVRSHQEQVSQNWGLDTDEHLFSPAYAYNLIAKGNDTGSSILSVVNIIKKRGVCTLASFPYNAADCATQPTPEQDTEAINYRAHNCYTIRGIDSIKKCLANGEGVLVAFDVYPDFRRLSPSNPIYDIAEGSESGSHAVCLIGYDDEQGAFKFINSWGTSWGLGGYGWISYELLSDWKVNNYAFGEAVGFVMGELDTDIYTEGYFDYTVKNGEAQIYNYFGTDIYVTIPDTLGGCPVTGIGNDVFMNCTKIEGVKLPDSVKYIGHRAFEDCWCLRSIRIPNNVTQIGDEAFANCYGLTSVTIPDSVTHIGVNAFHLVSYSGDVSPNQYVVLTCSKNSCAHKYAVDNSLKYKIVDFRDKVIYTTPLDNDNSVYCSCIMVTYTSDNMCSLYAGYVPVMKEIPIFIAAVYEGDNVKKVYISDNEEAIENFPAEDLDNCKMFVWTKSLQPCIETISGGNMQYQYLH